MLHYKIVRCIFSARYLGCIAESRQTSQRIYRPLDIQGMCGVYRTRIQRYKKVHVFIPGLSSGARQSSCCALGTHLAVPACQQDALAGIAWEGRRGQPSIAQERAIIDRSAQY